MIENILLSLAITAAIGFVTWFLWPAAEAFVEGLMGRDDDVE